MADLNAQEVIDKLATLGENNSTERQLYISNELWGHTVNLYHPGRVNDDGSPAWVNVPAGNIETYIAKGFTPVPPDAEPFVPEQEAVVPDESIPLRKRTPEMQAAIDEANAAQKKADAAKKAADTKKAAAAQKKAEEEKQSSPSW